MTEARRLNWERISNGELLKLAEDAGFEIIVTTDKKRPVSAEPCWAKDFDRGSRELALVACASTS